MKKCESRITEAQLKKTVVDYLQYGENQGKWFWLRLNAGSFILTDKNGKFRRRVIGAKKGTADFIVITSYDPDKPSCLVYFLELKSSKGKTTEAQDKFAKLVREQGASYFVIRSIEDVMEVLK